MTEKRNECIQKKYRECKYYAVFFSVPFGHNENRIKIKLR